MNLASVQAANSVNAMKNFYRYLMQIWTLFDNSCKKTDQLKEMQAACNEPELKMVKPSETRWLARERAVTAIRKCLHALVSTFENMYVTDHDTAALGLMKVTKYEFVASLLLACDVHAKVCILSKALQMKELVISSVPGLVSATIESLENMKASPDKSTVHFRELDSFLETELKDWDLDVIPKDRESFMKNVFDPYLSQLIDNLHERFDSASKILQGFAIFEPEKLRLAPDVKIYGNAELEYLIDFYGSEQTLVFDGVEVRDNPIIDSVSTREEWHVFRNFMSNSGFDSLISLGQHVLNSTVHQKSFPNVMKLLEIAVTLPVGTATVERSFSDMKLIKTRLRSHLTEESLAHLMRITIEGPEKLSLTQLHEVLDIWKNMRTRRLLL